MFRMREGKITFTQMFCGVPSTASRRLRPTEVVYGYRSSGGLRLDDPHVYVATSMYGG